MSTDGEHDDCELYRIVAEHARKITALEELTRINDPDRTLKVAEAARILEVSRQTVIRQAKADDVARRHSRNWRVPAAWVTQRKAGHPRQEGTA